MNTKILDDSIKNYFRLLRASKIEKSVKQKNRYDAVLLHMEGYPQKEITKILYIPHRTVCHHIASYKKDGMDALVIKKQPGAQKKLSDAQESEPIYVISAQTPEEAGAGVFANWTAAFVCTFVKQKYEILFSSKGCWIFLSGWVSATPAQHIHTGKS